jgi:uncharacterized membrane protein YccC
MDTTCWTIITTLAGALAATAIWGVKQAKGKEKILREWLDASREQLKLVSFVNEVNRSKR